MLERLRRFRCMVLCYWSDTQTCIIVQAIGIARSTGDCVRGWIVRGSARAKNYRAKHGAEYQGEKGDNCPREKVCIALQ